MRAYLRAPLAQDRPELVQCLVVGLASLQLCLGECRLGGRRTRRDRLSLCTRWKSPSACDRSARFDDFAPSHIHSLEHFDDREAKRVEWNLIRWCRRRFTTNKTHRERSEFAFRRIVTQKSPARRGIEIACLPVRSASGQPQGQAIMTLDTHFFDGPTEIV